MDSLLGRNGRKELKVSCISCKTESIETQEINIINISKATGFAYLYDISRGIHTEYLCVPCTEKAMSAINILKELFGDKLPTMQLLPLYRKVIP